MITRLALLPVAVALAMPAGDERPSIRLAEDGAVEVVGIHPLPEDRLATPELDASRVLTVAVLGAETPMLGRLRLEADRIRFEPRFPVRPGTTYRATFRPALLPGGDPDAPPIVADLTPADPDAPRAPTRLVAVYPSADRVPENLLRLYLHFSAPMSRGEAYRRLLLLGPDGEAVVSPFLELAEELWDPSGTRLTLLIDPGRIKQGLVPREELGPVLEAGRRYTLAVDPAWPDASGRPLASAVLKHFEAGPADETPPDPGRWHLEPPAAGTRDPLVVRFPEPLDHALLGRLLHVADASDRLLAGRPEILDAETRWSFTPDRPWAAGPYRLVADTDLEDLAGNGIGRPFEIDVFDRVEPRVEARSVAVPFQIPAD